MAVGRSEKVDTKTEAGGRSDKGRHAGFYVHCVSEKKVL